MCRVFLFISIFVLFVTSFRILFNVTQALKVKDLVDFSVYYRGIDAFLAHKNPYSLLFGATKNGIPFNYPPSAIILLLPLHLLPIKTAEIIITTISFISLVVSMWLIKNILSIKISLPHFLILCAFFIETFPFKFTVILGQINMLVLATSILSLFLYIHSNRLRKLYAASIVLFAISASLKLFPLYALLLFLIIGDYLFVCAVLLVFLLINVAPSVNLFIYYYTTSLPHLSRIGWPAFYDESIFAFLMRIFNNTIIAQSIGILTLLFLYLSTLTIFYKIYSKFKKKPKNRYIFQRDFLLAFATIFAIFSIGNSFSWQHHLVFSYPLVFLLYLKSLPKQKSIRSTILFHLFFLGVWIGFLFHFQNEHNILLKNPILASYQTILVLIITFIALIISFKRFKTFQR